MESLNKAFISIDSLKKKLNIINNSNFSSSLNEVLE